MDALSVLNGTANQFSEVTLQLFADDPKSLALFLLKRAEREGEIAPEPVPADGGPGGTPPA